MDRKAKQRQTRKPQRCYSCWSVTLHSFSAVFLYHFHILGARTRGFLEAQVSAILNYVLHAFVQGLRVQQQNQQGAPLQVLWPGFYFDCNSAAFETERQELLALAARLRAVGDVQTAQRLEEIALAPEQPNPTSPTRLLKAWNAAKNAVVQKTHQHAAMLDKVARWSVELEKARQTMLDLAVELYEAEQAERKARTSYETASAVLPGEIDEIMDVENDGEDDPEFHAKVMRALAAVSEVSEHRATKRQRLSGMTLEPRQSEGSATEPVSAVPAPEEASLQTVAVMQRRSPGVELLKRHRIPGTCNQVPVGSFSGQPLDILFNNINDWSRKAAAFFLQRRPRVALFVEHHLAASSLPREKSMVPCA